MQPLELTNIFTSRLEAVGLTYFVTGSVASLVYGEPRMTHDVDLVLTLADADARALVAAFPEADFYVPPLEVVRLELRRPTHGHFNLIHQATGFKADVYLAGHDPLHAWAMARRQRSGPGEGAFWLAPPEYVILRKLAWHREGGSEKHLRDLRGLVAVTGPDLDLPELHRWLARLGLEEAWPLVSGSAG